MKVALQQFYLYKNTYKQNISKSIKKAKALYGMPFYCASFDAKIILP